MVIVVEPRNIPEIVHMIASSKQNARFDFCMQDICNLYLKMKATVSLERILVEPIIINPADMSVFALPLYAF